jgi:hypothetical protein
MLILASNKADRRSIERACVRQHETFNAGGIEMFVNLAKCLLFAALVISPIGCEERPVVVDPDDDTTVIEERETVVEDTEPDGGVDVEVGEPGIDVDVDRDSQ